MVELLIEWQEIREDLEGVLVDKEVFQVQLLEEVVEHMEILEDLVLAHSLDPVAAAALVLLVGTEDLEHHPVGLKDPVGLVAMD
jgi:hypothetical protein